MKLYAINKWSEVFENADSRKRQRLGFYYMPSGCDSSGYLGLMSEFEPAEAWQAYGIFVALCQHTATMTKDLRGKFQNTDGTPMTTKRLALIVRADLSILERSLEILMDQRVAWMSATDVPSTCQQSASDVPQNSGFVQGQGQGQGQGQVEVEDIVGSEDPLKVIWDNAPKAGRERSSRKELKTEWGKIKDKPSVDRLKEALDSWNKSKKWVEGFAEGIHRWVKNEQWCDLPEVKRHNSALPKSLPIWKP
jgi:hypothetical protein